MKETGVPRLARQPRTWGAAIVLFLLASVIGETIASSNTPPLVIARLPALYVANAVIYGFSALLIRDLIRRRGRGWASWILLGAAYGALNEGVIAAKWFVPAIKGLPPGYGHALGVNWSWALALTLYHTVYSMLIPILLSEALFPGIADRPWLGLKWFRASAIIIVAVAVLFALTPTYQPYRLLALLLMGIYAALALVVPPARPRRRVDRRAPHLWTLRLVGFALQALMFALFYAAPLFFPPLVTAILFVIGAAALIWLLRAWTARADWTMRQTVALMSGAFGVSMLVAFTPAALAVGEPLAELMFLALLIALAWFWRWRARRATVATDAARAA